MTGRMIMKRGQAIRGTPDIYTHTYQGTYKRGGGSNIIIIGLNFTNSKYHILEVVVSSDSSDFMG